MPYCRLYYHIITATKNRECRITEEIEPHLYGWMKAKVYDLDGSLYAINGIEDHVHLIVSIPAKVAVAKVAVAQFIGQVKAFSSRMHNQTYSEREPFFWQEEYGVLTLDQKRLPLYAGYVEKQKEHHREDSLIIPLESVAEGEKRVGEEAAFYNLDEV